MATINYNGMELEEVTTPQIFAPPKRCVVFDSYDEIKRVIKNVVAVLPASFNECGGINSVITEEKQYWKHCALLPDPPKPRRAKNRELARWLAQGNGQIQYDDKTKNFGKSPDGERHKALKSTTIFEYFGADDFYVGVDIQVRKWSDTEWHDPDVDYLFGGDNA